MAIDFEKFRERVEKLKPNQDDEDKVKRPDWYYKCIMSTGKKPKPVPNVRNAIIALEADYASVLEFDEMQQKTMLHQSDPRPITDGDVTVIQKDLQEKGLTNISMAVVAQAIDHVARMNSHHPLRDYLDGLIWDGADRIEKFAHTYLGCEDSKYSAAVGAMFLMSMVARIRQPGCQADHMLVLEGPQGIGKSSACRVLGGEYFSDHLPDIGDKDASLHLKGLWLIEIAEMHAFSRAESTSLKSFVTRPAERYRPPYAHYPVDEKRQCVFIGTSNKDQYLRDDTGGRRFWPIKCGVINLDALARDRDQLFAEAVNYLDSGEVWYPTKEFEQEFIQPQQASRYEADDWTNIVTKYLDDNFIVDLTIADLAKDALQLPAERINTGVSKRLGGILRVNGWELRHTMHGNVWSKKTKP